MPRMYFSVMNIFQILMVHFKHKLKLSQFVCFQGMAMPIYEKPFRYSLEGKLVDVPTTDYLASGFFPRDPQLTARVQCDFICSTFGCPCDHLADIVSEKVCEQWDATHSSGRLECKQKITCLVTCSIVHRLVEVYMTIGSLPKYHSGMKSKYKYIYKYAVNDFYLFPRFVRTNEAGIKCSSNIPAIMTIIIHCLNDGVLKITNLRELSQVMDYKGKFNDPDVNKTLECYMDPRFRFVPVQKADGKEESFTLKELFFIILFGTTRPFDTDFRGVSLYDWPRYGADLAPEPPVPIALQATVSKRKSRKKAVEPVVKVANDFENPLSYVDKSLKSVQNRTDLYILYDMYKSKEYVRIKKAADEAKLLKAERKHEQLLEEEERQKQLDELKKIQAAAESQQDKLPKIPKKRDHEETKDNDETEPPKKRAAVESAAASKKSDLDSDDSDMSDDSSIEDESNANVASIPKENFALCLERVRKRYEQASAKEKTKIVKNHERSLLKHWMVLKLGRFLLKESRKNDLADPGVNKELSDIFDGKMLLGYFSEYVNSASYEVQMNFDTVFKVSESINSNIDDQLKKELSKSRKEEKMPTNMMDLFVRVLNVPTISALVDPFMEGRPITKDNVFQSFKKIYYSSAGEDSESDDLEEEDKVGDD